MKISSFNGTSVQKNVKNNTDLEAKKNSFTQNNSLNNSLSEVIGRSQIGFKSSFKPTPYGYEYQSSGHRRNSDSIKYDKENGSFVYGSKNQIVVFDPETGVETTTIAKKDYIIIKTSSQKEETVTKKDNKGAIIRQLIKNKLTGETHEYDRDISLGRIILKRTKNGIREAKVLDLSTGQYVAEGELTWVSEKDEERQMTVTRNVVTGAIVKEESLNPRNQFTRIYDEKTNQLTSELYYDRKNRLYVVKKYHNSGSVSDKVLFNQDKTYMELNRYNEADEETEHKIITKSQRGTKTEVFIPETDKIDYTRLDFVDNKTHETRYSITQFKKSPNVPESEKTYVKTTNRLAKEILFDKDGKTPLKVILYHEDNSKAEMNYDDEGDLAFIDYFNSENQKVSYTEYTKESVLLGSEVKIFRAVDYDIKTGKSIEYYYDESGKFYKNHYRKDKEGNIYEKATYYPKTNKIHTLIELENGVWNETELDKQGNVLATKQHSADIETTSNPKENEEYLENNFRYIPLKNTSYKTNEDKATESEQDTIKKIASVVDNGGNVFEISASDWDVVLDKLGLKNFSELDNLDENKYTRISKRILAKMNSSNFEESRNLLAIARFFCRGGSLDF